MLTSNPFAEISAFIPPYVMQTYVIVMMVLVIGGTIYDTLHKKSAKYFFRHWRISKNLASKKISAGQFASLAFNTLIVDALLSGEFCNIRRRVAHLLGMYGFVVFVATTAIMIFMYPTPDIPTPAIVSQLWHLGALMICIGGYWFWFFIRVDVAAEGNSPFGSVPWSKFAHMFFKPAAALQKRVEEANGSRNNLPEPADKPANLGSAREQARNY